MPCGPTQDRWVMVESYDKMWSTGEANGKPLQYSCLENSMERQKDRTLKDELPRSVGVNGEIAPEGKKRLNQSGNSAQLWMYLVVKVKSNAVKNSITKEPGMLGL